MSYWTCNIDDSGYVGNLLELRSHIHNMNSDRFMDILNHNYISNAPYESEIKSGHIDIIINRLLNTHTVIEIGCGTGGLLSKLSKKFTKASYVGTDISNLAIEFANTTYGSDNLSYKQFDIIKDIDNNRYDLALCVNVLEHFKLPNLIIDRLLAFTRYALIIVPFKQTPITDGYDEEGGAGKILSFDEKSFDNYNVVTQFKFTSPGWQEGYEPQLLCLLIKS